MGMIEDPTTKITKADADKRHRPSTSAELYRRIRLKFSDPEYALLPEVRNKTGGGLIRSADAIAISCYPSRGIDLHGMEIKVSRGDWLRELRDPNKAETIACFCDYWWIVAPNTDIVHIHEVPENWGLLVEWKADSLKVAKPVSRLMPKPLTKEFLASLMRNAMSAVVPQSEVPNLVRIEVDRIRKEYAARQSEAYDSAVKVTETRMKHLQDAVDQFEAVSGIKIAAYQGTNLGKAVKAVMQIRIDETAETKMRHIQAVLRDMQGEVARSLDAIQAAKGETPDDTNRTATPKH